MDGGRRVTILWLSLLALTVILRLLGGWWRPPWHDEYYTGWAASLPLGELVEALRMDSGPPLPYLLTRLMAPVTGSPLAAARLVSLLASAAAVLLLALTGARNDQDRLRFRWAATVVAVHPLALAWSAEGRAYGLLLFTGCWAVWAGDRISRLGRGYVSLALAVAIACWTHALGLVLAFSLAAVAIFARKNPVRRRSLLAIAGGLAAWLPWLPLAGAQPAGATEWLARTWEQVPALERLLAPGRLLPPFAPLARSADMPDAPWLLQGLGVLLILALLVKARSRATWLSFGLPALGLGCATLLGAAVFFPGRAEAILLAPFALLLAEAAARAWRLQGVLAACVLAWSAVSVVTVARWIAAPAPPEARLAESVAAALPAGGTVVVSGHWPLGLGFHLERLGGNWHVSPFPAALALHPGWQTPGSHEPRPGELEELLATLSAGETAIVLAQGRASAPALELLAVRLGLSPARAEAGAVLFLPGQQRRPVEGEEGAW